MSNPRTVRLATELEIKHYQELTAPIRELMHPVTGEPPEPNEAMTVIAQQTLKQLERFGYIPHPTHLLVLMDPSMSDVVLDDEQTEAVKADMTGLFERLGCKVN